MRKRGHKQIPLLAFVFTGLWHDPASRAATNHPIFTGWKMPVLPTHTNTPTFSLMGRSDLSLSTINYEHGNEVIHREVIGASAEVIITDRKPSASVTIDAPKLSLINLFTKARESATGALQIIHGTGAALFPALMLHLRLQIIHGTGAGGLIQIDAPKVSLSKACLCGG